MGIRTRIRAALDTAQMSQSELARKIGVQPSAVNHWLSGRSKALKAENLVRIAKALSVSADWLETGMGSIKPEASLTREEAEVIELYRALTPQMRETWIKVGRDLIPKAEDPPPRLRIIKK